MNISYFTTTKHGRRQRVEEKHISHCLKHLITQIIFSEGNDINPTSGKKLKRDFIIKKNEILIHCKICKTLQLLNLLRCDRSGFFDERGPRRGWEGSPRLRDGVRGKRL